ncbi:uncharacterized protein METZ01_LOCUS62257, partial [marine metagenome]
PGPALPGRRGIDLRPRGHRPAPAL